MTEKRDVTALPLRYRTIVADPPWERSFGENHSQGNRYGKPRRTQLPYECLAVEDIHRLPVADLAAPDAHLYLWATQRYLHESFHIVDAWGFRVSATITWCKAPRGFTGGAFRSSTEFCHFAKRGSLTHKAQAPSRWFTWPRAAGHSQKPESFLDLVESVSPGPYLELFARRNRLGWDTWGNEALQHVEVVA